ncbi:MAG: acyl-CoA dehydrogenase family protein [Bacteroidota bacterium]
MTEKDVGSDASNIQTTSRKVSPGTWLVNGNKKWIGNANRDWIVLFTKGQDVSEVNAFLLYLDDTKRGFSRRPIQNKGSLRGITNMILDFQDMEVSEEWRLPKVRSFRDIADILSYSRLYVGWLLAGIGLGVYDHTAKYIGKGGRLQFQLVQQRLVTIMSNVQASLELMATITKRLEVGTVTSGQLSLGKSWVSLKIREAAALGREVLGCEGLLLQNYLAKAMLDIEAVYTFEGTYEINSLILARELTGFSAIK